MACSVSIISYPLVCNGPFGGVVSDFWRAIITLNGGAFTPGCGGTTFKITKFAWPTVTFVIPFGPPTPTITYDWAYLSPQGIYTIEVTNSCCNIITQVTIGPDYNHGVSAGGYTTSATCLAGGSIHVIINLPSTFIIMPPHYLALLDSGNNIIQTSGPIFTNTHTFTGLPVGNYSIKIYVAYPPGNPLVGQSSICFYSGFFGFNIIRTCTLKAVSCPDPLFPTTLKFNGGNLSVSTINLILNKTIKAIFVSNPPGTNYAERCWNITEESGLWTASLISWLGPFDDCDLCIGTPCSDILSSITKTDEQCNQGNGTATVTPLNGTPPYIYQWSNGGNTQTISGLSAGSYSVNIIDMNDCNGTNSVIINNVPCSNYYIITPCDSDVRAFVIKDPITSPNPNPNAYIGNVFEGTVTLSNGTVLTGCFTLSVTSQVSTATASIVVTFYSHADCSGCLPLTWRLSRCDDNNIYYITNTNMSVSEGQVINNLVISGCGPGTFPCSTLPDQCWVVETESTGVSDIVVQSYGTVYPDCECCKPC